ncbi:hypothetical protein ACIQRS_21345 [Streptomyces termitum]|uniref:DUF3558 domain-containing protein n=1 Tax=Streptomyces termitum TaxID=67368 RepID=A0A918T640_9ACTN|nr:hypothetical protein [Streptomyces termitum]GHA86799.1 hypothetical protein GCM10010305_33350 [Streptomyces termitum]
MSTNTRRLAAAHLAGGLAASLTGCGDGREYTVPEAACGVPLDEKKLDPFLVDGKTFRIVGDSLTDMGKKAQGRCDLSVDDWLVVSFEVDKADKLYDPMDASESFRFVHPAKAENLPFPGLGAVGDRTAMISTECGGPEANYLVTEVRLSTKIEGDVAERRENIEAFAVDLVPKVKKALGCTS